MFTGNPRFLTVNTSPPDSLPKFERSVSCLCWAYNEKLLIEPFLIRLNQLLSAVIEDYEIVVVDDASTDGTREIIKGLRKKIPQIVLLENEKNRNVGICFRRAVQAATKEYLFWQTIDWSYDIRSIRPYLELLKDYDVVAGSRLAPLPSSLPWHEKAKRYAALFTAGYLQKRSDTAVKALISIVNYLLIRMLFHIPLTDYQNISIYPVPLIQSFKYESKSSFANPEGLIRAYWQGMRIAEVPIGFIPRSLGKAKGTKPRAVLTSVQNVLSLWWRWMVLKRFDFKARGCVFRLTQEEFLKPRLTSVS